MFYEPSAGHPLPRNPFKALVAPRPIGWISTRSPEGVNNLAPYSYFNAVADDPPMVMFASNGVHAHGAKDTADAAISLGSFVVNIATWDLRDAMNRSSETVPSHVDEFTLAGLTATVSERVAAPRVAEAVANLECETINHVLLPCVEGGRNIVVFGKVVGIHIRDDALSDGFFDITKVQPIARLGYRDYAVVRETFSMTRPAKGDSAIGM
ncbi:MAG: flavin reductase family protein [Pseudomonadota bacterium]